MKQIMFEAEDDVHEEIQKILDAHNDKPGPKMYKKDFIIMAVWEKIEKTKKGDN